MPITDAFIADPIGFTSRNSVWVVETQIDAVSTPALNGLVGGPHALTTANFLLGFDFDSYSGNKVLLNVKPAGSGTPCYFLPYKPDCGISMVLGGNADYFFTSTLTGCSVQAFGPRNAPTVTHSNARGTYTANLTAQTPQGDTTASGVAQTAIDVMFPAPVGTVGYVRKADYRGKLNGGNLASGAKRLKKWHQSFTNLQEKMHNNFKPEIGAFVFGVKDGAGDWSFYYQSTVGVTGTRNTGFMGIGVKHKALISAEVVLGATQRFYP